jgi:hypothetical protein
MLSLKESILSSTRTGKSAFKIIVNSWLELSNAIKKIIRKNSIHCSLNDIDTSKIESMSDLFEYKKFDGDISKWDVRNVTDMRHMFKNSQFNQDISNWKINPNCRTESMFENCPIRYEYKPKQNGKTIE